MPCMSDHRCTGNTLNLLSLQVESHHLPRWLVPKAGSLLPASVPDRNQSNKLMASASCLCGETLPSGARDEKEQGELEPVWTARGHWPWKSNQILAESQGHSSDSLPVFFFMLFVLCVWSFDSMVLVESEVKQYHRRKWTELVVFPTEPNPRNIGNIRCQPRFVRFPAW